MMSEEEKRAKIVEIFNSVEGKEYQNRSQIMAKLILEELRGHAFEIAQWIRNYKELDLNFD